MTPREFFDLMNGYQMRLDQKMNITAWHAANVMNVHTKKKVTVKKLLGKEKQASPAHILGVVDKVLLKLKEIERRKADGENDSGTGS